MKRPKIQDQYYSYLFTISQVSRVVLRNRKRREEK